MRSEPSPPRTSSLIQYNTAYPSSPSLSASSGYETAPSTPSYNVSPCPSLSSVSDEGCTFQAADYDRNNGMLFERFA